MLCIHVYARKPQKSHKIELMKLRENKQQANESIASQGLTNITKNLLSCESSSWIRVKHLLYKILCIIRNFRPWIPLEINHRTNNRLGYSLFSLCKYSEELKGSIKNMLTYLCKLFSKVQPIRTIKRNQNN